VVHTYSGHENKVSATLKQRIETMKLEDRIFDIVVPTRNIVTVKHGKKEDTKELEKLGLNKPIQVQYLIYMQGVIKGDLGTSLYFKKPNLDLIKECLLFLPVPLLFFILLGE